LVTNFVDTALVIDGSRHPITSQPFFDVSTDRYGAFAEGQAPILTTLSGEGVLE
jgi:hypothetical protein